ncbi:hypothetical protein EC973_004008 [Apophysomyces ossiformis]|uniref:F-box domain-containing protein n=1 Tax=Apophysomyces ossiformis TaxID=679940 RepID=A0A8H7BT79_9FUNG|nr:hypothetical protein EC973_004008 [Apophysomyces ossiformis]
MLIKELPPEILKSIAERLSRRSLRIALCVCRSWNNAMLPELYTSVIIYARRQFDLFTRSLERSPRVGRLVRKLYLRLDLENDTFSLLARLCPFLVEIDTLSQDWDRLNYFSKCKDLKKACIHFRPRVPRRWPPHFLRDTMTSLSFHTVDCSEWMDVLTKLSSLECVRIFLAINNAHLHGNMSCTQLEKLHQCLPRLRDLTLNRVAIYGDLPEPITPCDTVRLLCLKLNHGSRFGEYFARKYTHLEMLHLDATYSDLIDVETQIKPLARSCGKLKSLTVIENGPSVYSKFLNVLQGTAAPLSNFKDDGYDEPWKITTISSFRETLSEICIAIETESSLQQIINLLKDCPSLTDLSLIYSQGRFNLDLILDELNGLTKLTLSADSIGLMKNDNGCIQQRLRSFTAKSTIVQEAVFDYLMRCCQRLSSLEWHYCGGNCPSFTIYYTNPSLKLLDIKHYEDAIFKITRLNEEERVREWNHRYYGAEQDEMKGFTEWYMYDNESPFKKLKRTEIEETVAKYKRYKEHELHAKSRGKRISAQKPIISIICHWVDIIRINANYVI